MAAWGAPVSQAPSLSMPAAPAPLGGGAASGLADLFGPDGGFGSGGLGSGSGLAYVQPKQLVLDAANAKVGDSGVENVNLSLRRKLKFCCYFFLKETISIFFIIIYLIIIFCFIHIIWFALLISILFIYDIFIKIYNSRSSDGTT